MIAQQSAQGAVSGGTKAEMLAGVVPPAQSNGTILTVHVDSGSRCLLGGCEPPCIRCKVCHGWIRPEDMNGECAKETK